MNAPLMVLGFKAISHYLSQMTRYIKSEITSRDTIKLVLKFNLLSLMLDAIKTKKLVNMKAIGHLMQQRGKLKFMESF